MSFIQAVEEPHLRKDLPQFKPGDTVKVQVKVVEGDKERLQAFEGICIRRRGTGLSATFTVRKVTYGGGGGGLAAWPLGGRGFLWPPRRGGGRGGSGEPGRPGGGGRGDPPARGGSSG